MLSSYPTASRESVTLPWPQRSGVAGKKSTSKWSFYNPSGRLAAEYSGFLTDNYVDGWFFRVRNCFLCRKIMISASEILSSWCQLGWVGHNRLWWQIRGRESKMSISLACTLGWMGHKTVHIWACILPGWEDPGGWSVIINHYNLLRKSQWPKGKYHVWCSV